ncbi:MAG: MBL fold metallo-hydrolase [Parachlamydia sp.]|nr:MBL fold metallo-hydrolase [Parachlamydia sp.]
MKIAILGTRGEIKESLPRHEKHSGLLIDDQLLLDLGEKEFLETKPKWILLTHLHPDHAYFVRWKAEEMPPTAAPIYAPETPKHVLIQNAVQLLDQPIKLASYTITPIPTHHSKLVKSQAYLIQKGKVSLLYTGDLVWIDKQYLDPLRSISLVITDGSFLRKGGMVRKDKETQTLYGHNGIPNLIDLFKAHTSVILFVHFGSWFYKDTSSAQKKLEELGKQNGVQVLLGHDGMQLTI